jgi:hypothetical protein
VNVGLDDAVRGTGPTGGIDDDCAGAYARVSGRRKRGRCRIIRSRDVDRARRGSTTQRHAGASGLIRATALETDAPGVWSAIPVGGKNYEAL